MGILKDKYNSLPKESRKNIVIMVLLVLMFIIGIIVRWDFIGKELGTTVDRYSDMFQGKNPDAEKE